MGAARQAGVKFLRFPDLGNLEWLHASYEKQSFSPHFHKGHVIGVIEKVSIIDTANAVVFLTRAI